MSLPPLSAILVKMCFVFFLYFFFIALYFFCIYSYYNLSVNLLCISPSPSSQRNLGEKKLSLKSVLPPLH